MDKRAVFVDKRDMPKKLYPCQFRITGTFTQESDGEEVSMELFVEVSQTEVRLANSRENYNHLLLSASRKDVLAEVSTYVTYTKKMVSDTQTTIKQIKGEIEVVEPPEKGEHDATS